MADRNDPIIVEPADDVYAWLENGSSIMLKAVTKQNDPVELTSGEARDIAAALQKLADELDRS